MRDAPGTMWVPLDMLACPELYLGHAKAQWSRELRRFVAQVPTTTDGLVELDAAARGAARLLMGDQRAFGTRWSNADKHSFRCAKCGRLSDYGERYCVDRYGAITCWNPPKGWDPKLSPRGEDER